MRVRTVCGVIATLACLSVVGCGGGGRSAAPAPVVEEPVVESGESGIPGLSVADVEAMPEVPELPGSIGPDASDADLQAAVDHQVDREDRRGLIETVGPEKRRIHLGWYWGQALHQLRRAQPSEVEGLTIGELEDQPPAPPLPEIFGSASTVEDLTRHARVVAMEERDQGVLGELEAAKRVTFLTWYWQEPLAARQAIVARAKAERQALHQMRLDYVTHVAEWDARNEAVEDEFAERIYDSKHTFNPVLKEGERAYLERILQQSQDR